MRIEIVLEKLLENNIKLSVKEDKLLCKLPDSGIDDKLLDLLKTHKEELKKVIQEKTKFQKHQSITNATELSTYPLTPSQKRFWILSQFEGGSQAYNMSFVTKTKGDLHKPHFERAFFELIKRYEILRTQFKFDNTLQEVRQNIVPTEEIAFNIDVKDFSEYSDCNERVEEYLTLKSNEIFDLEVAPLLRMSLLKTAEKEHVFLLSMHHIISDGWSMELIISEIVRIYNDLTSGKDNITPPLRIQYKDYAVWLEGETQKDKYKQSEKYWLEKISGDISALNIPSFKQRPTIQTFNGNSLSQIFSVLLTDRVKHFSEVNKVTVFVTLISVVKALLHRYSNQGDIIVGTPIAGREHPDLENQIGLFVNTIVIRTSLNAKQTFADLLQIEKNNLVEANEHQMYPFDQLVKNLNLKKDLSRSPLFDVLVVYQNQSLLKLGNKKEDANNLTFEKYNFEKKTSQFDITFSFFENDNQIGLNIEYNTDIYDSSLIEQIFSHFENILSAFIEQPQLLIGEVDYISESEKQQLLFDFNATQVDYPKNKTVVDLFNEQYQKTPDRIAVKFEGKSITYKELFEQSNQLANYLISNYAIEPNDLVGIKLDRSEKMIIAIFGILKSGGAYVPIDVDYPQERVDYIINDANLKICITDDEFNKFILQQKSLDKVAPITDNQIDCLAYCIYTSGSTGNPKGVLNQHVGLYNRLIWMKDYLNVTSNDVFLQKTPYTFDVSVWELILPFITGSSLVIAKPEGHKDPSYLNDIIVQNQVTIIHFVPSMLNAFLAGIDQKEECQLSHIICSGEELSVITAQECKEKFKQAQLHNLYGPTEASIDVTAINLTEIDVLNEGVSIGKPISNTQIYIVSDSFKLQPIGVPGELLISGIQVAKGYLNLPQLTQERFIPDPFTIGNQIYRTGDIAYWKPDGSIQYLGRIDNQVKIRGNRIELGEVENRIMEYQGIAQAVVTPKLIGNEKVLVAYYLTEKDSTINKTEIRNYLQGRLPGYMHPSFYVQLETLPMTTSGKVNRNALPNVNAEDCIRHEYVAPRNEEEQKIALVWQEVLGLDKVGITDNFFELGGHSLLLSQIINRISKQLGKTVSFATFFANQTIEELYIQLKQTECQDIPKASELASYPLTASQSRLWVLSQLEGGSLAYNMPAAFKLTGVVNIEMFNESFQLLIQRHEILRTYFKTNEEGDIHQYILPLEETNLTIAQQDYSNSNNQEQTISDYLEDINKMPFNLEQAPLIRVALLKVKEDEYVFFLCLHHIIGDGWSIELLLSEVIQTYNALTQGKTINLPELNIQYKDYAVWLNNTLQQEKQQVSEEYWLTQFAGELPVLDLPSFKTRPMIKTYNGDYVAHRFSKEFLEKLKVFSKEQEVTLFMVLMAGINTMLHRYTGLDDIIIGTPIAGRDHSDLENQMGLYLNTLPIRTKLKVDNSFLELLATQKETLLGAYDHQSYPFDALVGKLDLKRDMSRSVLFDVMVVLQNQSQLNNLNTKELINLKVDDYQLSRKTAQFDVNFIFTEIEGLNLSIEYNTDIYDAYLIERMFVHFENLLTAFLENPKKLVASIDYITEFEKQKLLFDFNDTKIEYPKHKTIIDLFEEQADRTPNNVAVIFEELELTYKELNEQANQLAHYLSENYAIKPDDLIGIQLDRSERMIISIFGILKSGAAYIPMDVDYPQERVDYITSDANLKLCINENEFNKFTLKQESYSKVLPKLSNLINNLAYCIYTSGSTGKPKGVLNHHAGLYNRLLWMQSYLEVTEKEVFLQKTPYTFDVSVWELILPFITGSSLVIARPEGHKDVSYLQEIISEKQVTIIHFVPSMLNVFLLYVDETRENFLSHIICSGEELSSITAQECKEKFKKSQLHNLYGPTEASIDVTALNLTEIDVIRDGVTIGKPVSNTNIYIVDNSLKLQPLGVPGELLISGIQVAKGYLNLPELTTERFIADPFVEGSRVYRTGDLAMWNLDGTIKYLGRNDNQVKIRGNRIELGEIEGHLERYSGVRQVVVAVKEMNSDKVLIGYLVLDNILEIEKESLKTYLREYVPEYMIPTYLVYMEELPLTSSGKVDRKKLAEATDNDVTIKDYVPPQNELEKQILAIINETVTINEGKIGITDNFFEIGLTSLSILKVARLINTKLHIEIKPLDLFKYPNVKSLVANFTNKEEHNSEEFFSNAAEDIDIMVDLF
jgi:amino acid adenylation domain-containing protein